MQNSLERLFDGLASALCEDVLPAVDDPYARSQLLASVELLANLAERVEWRCADLREEIGAVRAVLGRGDEPLPEDNAGLVEARREALDALARAQEQGLDTPELRELLGSRLERELGRLRTGMYR
jgi:hypothetical protein